MNSRWLNLQKQALPAARLPQSLDAARESSIYINTSMDSLCPEGALIYTDNIDVFEDWLVVAASALFG